MSACSSHPPPPYPGSLRSASPAPEPPVLKPSVANNLERRGASPSQTRSYQEGVQWRYCDDASIPSHERTPLVPTSVSRPSPKNNCCKAWACMLTFLVFVSLAASFFLGGYIAGIISQRSCHTLKECQQQKLDRDRLVEERRRAEERRKTQERLQRQKRRLEAGMRWDTPTPAQHCTSYGTREYSATLLNIPWRESWEESCEMTPIVIHNVTLETPDRCENNVWNGMRGYWLITFDETSCIPFWGSFEDEGCTAQGSGKRRFSSRLWNVRGGDDWDLMCGSTPTDIHGVHFAKPTSCDNRGFLGMWGIWDIDDSGCQELL